MFEFWNRTVGVRLLSLICSSLSSRNNGMYKTGDETRNLSISYIDVRTGRGYRA